MLSLTKYTPTNPMYSHNRSLWLLRLLSAHVILLTILLLIPPAQCNHDWIQNCSVCHCHWNSGKKSADCKNCHLEKIPDNLSNEMQVIDFSHNLIPELRREEFMNVGLLNLHKLFLRNCTIQEVNRDAFKGLEILIELDMSNNNISKLHPGTFGDLDKLRILLMNNNQIEVLENYLFVDLPFLSRVEFKHNRLKQVQLHAFGRLDTLVTIELEFNSLTHLHKETFQHLQKLVQLSLSENKWNCTCELKEFRDFTVGKRLYTPPTSCHDPAPLRGKLWIEVPSENFACRPRILGLARSYIETQSDNITLPCRIVGTPYPNVTWIYNKRLLNLNDARIKVLNSIEMQPPIAATSIQPAEKVLTSELRINGLRATDKGTYTCVAENRGGKAEADFKLYVNGDYIGERGAGDVIGAGGMGMGGGGGGATGASTSDTQSDILLVICLIAMALLLILIVVMLILCWYCRRIKTYQKDSTMMSENGLISSKMEKTHNGSMLEGSVIMEMQKSLLTEVNPVEKPPRRTDIESVDGGDEGHEIKKTLLDETAFGNHPRDDETHSVALSDTTAARSRHTYVDDTYGTPLPPDLLAFPARVPPTSPSMQSSQSNIPDQIIYGIRSPPLTSPVYAHMTPHGIYGTTTIAAATPNGFMTLQHPKSRNLALIATANRQQHPHVHAFAQQQQQQQQQQIHHVHQLQQQHQQQQQQQQQSPFLPAPVVYSPATAVVMKQGYMTIPRKPRVPSWAPSTSVHGGTPLSEFQSPTSPNPSETGTATTAELQSEPVYDNLGLRTTAGGNSILNLHKATTTTGSSGGNNPNNSYTMRDRPLPATPSLTSVASNATLHNVPQYQQQQQAVAAAAAAAATTSKIYEPIHELLNQHHQQQQQQQKHQQQLLAAAAAAAATRASNTFNADTEPLYGAAMRHGITILPAASISGSGSAAASPTLSSSTVATTSTALAASAASPGSSTTGGGGSAGVGSVSDSPKITKIPPRPPPKPKKKMSVTATRTGQGSTSQLFDDEGEDGTEV